MAKQGTEDARHSPATTFPQVRTPFPGPRSAEPGAPAILAHDVLANVQELEAIALEELVPPVERHEQVGDVRAAGALVGIEFVKDKASIAPAPAFHRSVHHAALRRGVLAITQWGKWVYRLQPALNMPPELFR